jgi:hypothetical protein
LPAHLDGGRERIGPSGVGNNQNVAVGGHGRNALRYAVQRVVTRVQRFAVSILSDSHLTPR